MAEEADFMRSVLPVHGSFQSDDSSLAIPNTDKRTHVDTHRRNRLQQQVQLTLSRKRKKPKVPDSSLSESLSSCHISRSISLGNIHYKRIMPFVNYDGTAQTTKPLWMADRSQLSNPEPSRFHRGFGSFRCRTKGGIRWGSNSFTLPCSTPTNHFHMTKHSLRYAESEVLRNPRLYVSGHSAVRQLPSKPAYVVGFEDDTDDVFMPSTPHNPALERQAFRRTLSLRREVGFGSHEQTDNVSWQTHKRKLSLEVVAGRQPFQAETQNGALEKSGSLGRAEILETKQQTMTASIKMGKQSEQGTEMTLKKAVYLLEEDNMDVQISAANFIQSQCFNKPDAKIKLHVLKGIPKLLKLLDSDSEELQQAASSVLRNAVYENNENKMEVKECEGIPVILGLLKENREIETRRQLTGLLWNLSSHDLLKEQLSREAVKPLTDNVLVPCSGICEGEDPKLDLLSDPEIFYNATGCLRNLSSAGPDGREAMRDCEGLIECLIYYIRGTIADYKPDEKATENCVCILHNLSYRFDCGMPQLDGPDVQESKQNLTSQTNPGCFIMTSPKTQEEEIEEDYPLLEENANPQGAEWLWSAITVRMYLSLIAVSANQSTKVASIGALQNLTACTGEMSQAIAHFIVRKEGGLLHVRKMLQEEEREEIRISVSLVKNISRYRELHKDIVREVLTDLIAILPNSDNDSEQPTEVTVTICQILVNLSHVSAQNTCAIVNQGALSKIIRISTKNNGYGPTRAGKAACILLQTMWRHTDLRSGYKKAGYKKSDFINSKTLKAVNSASE